MRSISRQMGRTRRKRKKRQPSKNYEFSQITELQKTLRLKCHKLQINFFNHIGWGIRCKQKVDEGEILIALPLRHLITTDVNCEIFKVLRLDNETPQFILSIFVNYESHLKGKSRHLEYIQSLPKSFTNPYYCTKNEINLLPEFIRNEVNAQITFINTKLEKLSQLLSGKSCPHCGENLRNIFSSEKFVWAWFIVNTRSVFFEDKKQTKSLALAPFLDLFNHSNDAVTKLLIDFENELYILKTLIGYRKFEQVFIKYGAHNNLKLFLEYGFVLPYNDNDFVEFTFEEVLESVREFGVNFGKISQLKYNFIKLNKLNQNLIKSSEFSWNFNRLVYVLSTTDQDLSVLQAKTYSDSFLPTEKNTIEDICKIAMRKKYEQFNQILVNMEAIRDCTASFNIAKHLMKTYMNLLH